MLGTQVWGCNVEPLRDPASLGNSHGLCPSRMNAASFSSICSRYIFILASLTLVLAFPTRIQFSPKKIRRKVLISHEVLLLSSSPLSLSHFEHTHPPPLFPGRLWHSGPETGEPGCSGGTLSGGWFRAQALAPTQEASCWSLPKSSWP